MSDHDKTGKPDYQEMTPEQQLQYQAVQEAKQSVPQLVEFHKCLFDGYIAAGFTEDQALSLLSTWIMKSE